MQVNVAVLIYMYRVPFTHKQSLKQWKPEITVLIYTNCEVIALSRMNLWYVVANYALHLVNLVLLEAGVD